MSEAIGPSIWQLSDWELGEGMVERLWLTREYPMFPNTSQMRPSPEGAESGSFCLFRGRLTSPNGNVRPPQRSQIVPVPGRRIDDFIRGRR